MPEDVTTAKADEACCLWATAGHARDCINYFLAEMERMHAPKRDVNVTVQPASREPLGPSAFPGA